MCFNIHSKHKEAKTAKTDITCYKVLKVFLGIELESPYYEFKYVLNEKVFSEIHVTDLSKILKGLHSYSNKKMATHERAEWYYPNFRVFEAVIPKGATYYYNPDAQEYVSDQIIITECLT